MNIVHVWLSGLCCFANFLFSGRIVLMILLIRNWRLNWLGGWFMFWIILVLVFCLRFSEDRFGFHPDSDVFVILIEIDITFCIISIFFHDFHLGNSISNLFEELLGVAVFWHLFYRFRMDWKIRSNHNRNHVRNTNLLVFLNLELIGCFWLRTDSYIKVLLLRLCQYIWTWLAIVYSQLSCGRTSLCFARFMHYFDYPIHESVVAFNMELTHLFANKIVIGFFDVLATQLTNISAFVKRLLYRIFVRHDLHHVFVHIVIKD